MTRSPRASVAPSRPALLSVSSGDDVSTSRKVPVANLPHLDLRTVLGQHHYPVARGQLADDGEQLGPALHGAPHRIRRGHADELDLLAAAECGHGVNPG